MNCMRLISIALASVFLAFNAHGQFELKAGNFNGLFIPQTPDVPATPVGGNENNAPATPSSNYQGMGQVSSGTGPIAVATEHADRYPSNNDIVLTRSTMGGVFTSGVPRYFMGDLILPPLVQADEITPAAANYWRAKPILPGEAIPGLGTMFSLSSVEVTESSTNGAGVTVTTSPLALVVGATLLGQPITRIIGTGPYSVTLAGNANVTVASGNPLTVDITPATPFYYSPHAEKVYGSQPGQVSITWVTRLPNKGGIHETLEETFAVSSNTARPVRTIFWTEGAFDGPVVQITDGRISTVNPIFYSAVPKSVPEEANIPGNEPISPDLSTLSFDKFAGVGQLHAYNVEGRILIEYLGDVRLGDNIYNQIGTDVVDIVRVPPESLETVHLGFEILPHDGDTSLTASPLLSAAQNPVTYYGTNTRPDGSSAYWAERETSAPENPDNGKPESNDAYNKVVFYWLEQGDFSINWPKFQDRYWQRWSPNLPDYAHYTVDNAGSTPDTGVPFSGGNVPQIVYQDDPTQSEASIDLPTQSLFVTFAAPPADKRNRSLLKFSAGSGKVWYVNLYTQGEDRGTTPTSSIASKMITVPSTAGMTVGMTVTGPGITGEATIVSIIDGTRYILSQDIANATNNLTYAETRQLSSTSSVSVSPTFVTVGSTLNLEVGMIVTGTGINETVTIEQIIDRTHLVLSHDVNATNDFTYTVESDAGPPIDDVVIVGTRLLPPAGHEIGGYLSGGSGYYPAGYLNPFVTGITAANTGAIIPVNALPDDKILTVRWFKRISKPSAEFQDLFVPGKVGRYTANYPSETTRSKIVIAQGVGTDDLPPAEAAGSIYYQNNRGEPGYNPNDEHAKLLGGRAYALREDLNVFEPYKAALADGDYTSEPFVLVAYTDPADDRPAIHAYRVVREIDENEDRIKDSGDILFDYTATAGTLLVTPYPLPLLNLPLEGEGVDRASKNVEIMGADPADNGDVNMASAYENFTFQDRKGFVWVHRGPHDGGTPGVRSSTSDGSTTIMVDTTEGLEMGMTVTGPGITGTATIDSITDGTHYVLSQSVAAATGASLTYGQQPSFGMKFYYTQRAEFDFPALLAENKQPAVGSIQPFIADTGDGSSVTLAYLPKWPDDTTLPEAQQKEVPELMMAQTLAKPKDGLPQVFGQTSAQVLYQQSMAMALHAPLLGSDASSVALHDPIRKKTSPMEELPPGLLTSDYAGKTYFQGLPPNLQNRFYYDPFQKTLELIGEFVDEIATEDYFNLNQLSSLDVDAFKALLPEDAAEEDTTAWTTAIDGLVTTLETFRESTTVPGTYVVAAGLSKSIAVEERSDVTDPDTAVAGYALSSTGGGTGYVTLVFGNGKAFTDEGDPVQMQIIKVVPDLYPGDLKVLLSSNPLDEKVTVRHSGDYGGQPENFEFRYRYGFNDSSGQAPILPLDNSDTLPDFPDWFDPDNTPYSLGGSILVGADPSAVLSNPAVLMGDVNFTMSYRLKVSDQADGEGWSNWTRPALVEGWIKRVLAKITPFNQRVTDLYSNSLNTDVSMITQAGTRWEGDIALNMENINDSGLIEIYETVLNRGKGFTINSDLDTASTNNALILAAGYLNDLYTILGNEAYADGANPTISIDDQDSVTEVNTSRFSFEGQVASSLEEELALLRGRDDFSAQGTSLAPAYNRLWWNFTRGINSGEALYAVNYNIKEKEGSTTANGVVDAADAQRMFPQGHGDAYGHYLTALKGYYKLLTHPYFTWTPSAETVTVLGVPVSVDYKDERKFAAAAANVGRTAQQVLGLVHRQSYQDDPDAGWSHFRDGKTNPRTDVVRHQGMDETASRSTQSAFFHWIVGNAMLPDVDENPNHSGVQIVDRTTVPELHELPALALSYQTTMDSANGRLNPLGLAPGAIAFDLDPYWNNSQGQELSGVDGGASHYEQISARALRALNNAAGSFNQAATMTRLLRNQENQISDQQTAIEDEEYATLQELLDIYGSPYPGDIGPGKIYPQGYEHPDYLRWAIIDRPLGWIDTTTPATVTYRYPVQYQKFSGQSIDNIIKSYEGGDHDMDGEPDTVAYSFQVIPNQWVEFADLVGPGTALGKRPSTGALQDALVEAHLAQIALLAARDDMDDSVTSFERETRLFKQLINANDTNENDVEKLQIRLIAIQTAIATLDTMAEGMEVSAEFLGETAEAAQAFLPKVVGFSNDLTSAGRGALQAIGNGSKNSVLVAALVPKASARALALAENAIGLDLDNVLLASDYKTEALQGMYEFEQTYRDLIGMYTRFTDLVSAYATATQKVQNLLVLGDTIRLRRETLRQRAAAVINGYRTKDLTFRTFRNEALVQYRNLFDLAGKYSYLAAKSYDYETGLLGTSQGQAVINRLVASRSLGDLTGGEPQATTSTLGDAGLAGTMAQLNADFAVAEGRLGINNPDHYNTLFSLRQELFRILPHVEDVTVAADKAWQQTLEQHIVPNVLSDPQVAAYCRGLKKADGSAIPGFIIPFSTTVEDGKNFFGLDLAAGDHAYSQSNFSTKIAAVGVALPGYVGSVDGESTAPNALSATPYAYLIPCGTDYMRTPLGDTGDIRSWQVVDQALPLPYNLGASDFNTTQFFGPNDSFAERPWVIRKHQAFRMVADPALYEAGDLPLVYTNARLIGRSVWNSQWKIVIPAVTLLEDEQMGLNNFAASVDDIKLFLRTYSNSGN